MNYLCRFVMTFYLMKHNDPLKFVPATKGAASTGLANARHLAGRYACIQY
ncbi:hypothetical protein EV696_1102 [Permianibacter aggregans]|uniref:Uncharacterized protein n=1 Tax=Permianibacter aggregans TaxID=1510150 RepID=A0A4R6UKA3_9GAMM|nr:hypothetical protein EV696_1102 [Permianibacter aggregans]